MNDYIEKPKGFWGTIPGILTSTAAIITAISGVIVSLKTIDSSHAGNKDYEVIRTNDGFTSVRESPTRSSKEIARLTPGIKIECSSIVKGELLWGSSDWVYCKGPNGYIHSKLLVLFR